MNNPRFGVMISKAVDGSDTDIVTQARHAEALGFDVVMVHPDHLHGVGPTLETWTALTWVAAHTTRVSVAPGVLSLPYRHPAVIAKMAETLSRLSGGRLILPLGGGNDQWTGAFRALGVPQRSPGETVQATEEALDILHGLWAEPAFSYAGQYFQIEGASLEPRPAYPISVWLGAYGPKMLALTGRKADGWFPSLVALEPDAAYAKLQLIRRAAANAGRDPDTLTYAYNVGVRIEAGKNNEDSARPQPGQPRAPGQIAGAAPAVAAQLAAFLHNGFTFLNLWPSGDLTTQLDRLANEVVPAVRALATP
jgi:alkanesulfonate monooxygenase SsuD/methylene tetrahydromethanopterin reductase-like flavin-dependent oxidoreductase (luciferase family)